LPLWQAMMLGLQNNDATKPYYCLAQDYIYEKPQDNFILLGNHDMERFATTINNDIKKYKLGLVWLATMRGIPQIYYGDELMMTGAKGINDGFMRQDMPGGWDNDFENIFTKKIFKDNQNALEALQFNQQIWNWRKKQTSIHKGKLIHYYPKNGVYAYKRYLNNKATIVFLNFSTKNVIINWNDYKELIYGYKIFSQQFTNTGTIPFSVSNSINLAPHDFLVLSAE
jgi:neopullulanase